MSQLRTDKPQPPGNNTLVLCPHRHPLFPLLALLFEKCEQSTQGSEGTTSASFDVDIENFVRKQEKEGRPFFCEDPETDNLVSAAPSRGHGGGPECPRDPGLCSGWAEAGHRETHLCRALGTLARHTLPFADLSLIAEL